MLQLLQSGEQTVFVITEPDNIDDSSKEVQTYLKFREAMKSCIYFCILEIVLMIMFLLTNNDKAIERVTSLKISPYNFTVFFIVNLFLNMSSNLLGIWALSNNSNSQHIYFQLMLLISLVSEILLSFIMLPYILILVPRIGLFVYELFLAYKFMPAALDVNSKDYDIEN